MASDDLRVVEPQDGFLQCVDPCAHATEAEDGIVCSAWPGLVKTPRMPMMVIGVSPKFYCEHWKDTD